MLSTSPSHYQQCHTDPEEVECMPQSNYCFEMDTSNETSIVPTVTSQTTVQNVASPVPVTTIATNPTASTSQGSFGEPTRMIQLTVPVAAAPGTSTMTIPPRPPTPHSSIVTSIAVTTTSTTLTCPIVSQATPPQTPPPSSQNLPRICNLGPLIYLQATTGVKGSTAVSSSMASGNNATSTPVQFTMPQVISESSKNPRTLAGASSQGWLASRRIIGGNTQIIHANSSQSNQAYAYLGTLIKQGIKGKEATSQKVLLTPMPMQNKSPQMASVLLPGNEAQGHGSKTPMASLILQPGPGGNVQGKMTGLILGNTSGGSPGNKTSLLLPAPPGGAPGKKAIANINIPVPVQTGKSSVPNIIRQSNAPSVTTGKTFILPQGGNSPGLIIPASSGVNKSGANQVTGLLLPSNTSSSGIIIPPSTSSTSPLTNLIFTTPTSSSHCPTSNAQMASLIISNPSSSASATTGNIIVPPITAAVNSTTALSTLTTTVTTPTSGTKMTGLFLPVSMEVAGVGVPGKNNVTHHLTISNGKIQTADLNSAIAVPALKPVSSFGLPALQPITKDGSNIPKPGRSLLKKNIDLTLKVDDSTLTAFKDVRPKKDEYKEEELPAVIQAKSDMNNVVEKTSDSEIVPEIKPEIKSEVDDKIPGSDSDQDKAESTPDVTNCDPNKENTLPNVKDEDDVAKTESRMKTPPPEDFDPMKVLEWDSKGVGKLPGSDLKFRLNEFGMMILHDESDKSDLEHPPTATPEKKDERKPHKEPVKAKEKQNSDEIYCCDGCGCYGLSTEFLDTKYCSVACRKIMSMKCAINRRREEEKLRDLKLRKKRRKMKIIEIKKKEAEMLQGESKRREREIDWLKEFVELKAKRLGSVTAALQEPEDGKNDTLVSPAVSEIDISISRSGTTSPTLTDIDDHLDKKVPWLSKSGEFLWNVYIAHHKAKAAHIKLFKDPFPYQKNGFRVGMKLEGIDPEHQSYICVLTVAEVRGFRLRLHFDGYPENHDFWTNADSLEIFQPGWCEKNNHHLYRPRGYTVENFNWNMYLKQCKAQAAPRNLFSNRHANPVTPNQFRVGMKVEAVDRHNNNLVCVATVNDIIDNRLLIHFDSWGDVYDYWVDPTSPYIHPVGWCRENGHELTPPNNYKNPNSFSWDSYLKETKSVAAPARAFKPRPPNGFRCGMKLEAVDKRAPHLLRVATVIAANQHQIKIAFDGFPEQFGYWVDDDSIDIHPVGWAQKTGHPLELPPSGDEKVECTTPGCRGDGHIKGTKYTNHKSASYCPYSPQFLNKDSILPDRFSIKPELLYDVQENVTKSKREDRESSVTTDGTGNKGSCDGDSGDDANGRRSVTSNEDESRSSRLRPSNYGPNSNVDKKPLKRKLSTTDDSSHELKKLRKDLIESVLRPGVKVVPDEYCWAKHSFSFGIKALDVQQDNPINWTPKQVSNFLASIHPIKSKMIVDQEIDGEALLMLSQSDLITHLGLKLGPAIKIYNIITMLRQKLL